MKFTLRHILLWIILPFINFILFLFYAKTVSITELCSINNTNNNILKSNEIFNQNNVKKINTAKIGVEKHFESVEDILQNHSKQEDVEEVIEIEEEIEIEGENETLDISSCSCSSKNNVKPIISNHDQSLEFFKITNMDTKIFDSWRSEKLAQMSFEFSSSKYFLLNTLIINNDKDYFDTFPYLSLKNRNNLINKNKNYFFDYYSQTNSPTNFDNEIIDQFEETNCLTIDHFISSAKEGSCVGVFFDDNLPLGEANPIVRIDSNIDYYGLSISKPDPAQIDEYSYRFPINEKLHVLRTTGFFRRVPKVNGRLRTKMKLGTLVLKYDEVQEYITNKFKSHGLLPGTDIILMAINEGEIDLFLNFVCSLNKHNINHILSKVVVFSGSESILPTIEATGAIALFHEGFATVSTKASTDYLDRVFVDMMWYKSFSLFLTLNYGFNVLFQDVDLVWFRDPFPFFQIMIDEDMKRLEFLKEKQIEIINDLKDSFPKLNEESNEDEIITPTSYTYTSMDSLFSDDGQRSHRYSPFYANSGFYYLKSNDRSKFFAAGIMNAMDSIQVLGSHQNVFTNRWIEHVSITGGHTNILNIYRFPTGILYHHNLPFMKKFLEKDFELEVFDDKYSELNINIDKQYSSTEEKPVYKYHELEKLMRRNTKKDLVFPEPFNFHMCWTQGKKDKLNYFRKSKLWYLSETCSSLPNIVLNPSEHMQKKKTLRSPPGVVYQSILDHNNLPVEEQLDNLESLCCINPDKIESYTY